MFGEERLALLLAQRQAPARARRLLPGIIILVVRVLVLLVAVLLHLIFFLCLVLQVVVQHVEEERVHALEPRFKTTRLARVPRVLQDAEQLS